MATARTDILPPEGTGAIPAFPHALTIQHPRVELPLLHASTAPTLRPEPLVKNSLEKADIVDRQDSVNGLAR